MIVQYCDVCNRRVYELNTIVLYKKPIEYCDDCRNKVMIIAKEYKQIMDYEREQLHKELRKKEKYFVDLLKGNEKNVIDKK